MKKNDAPVTRPRATEVKTSEDPFATFVNVLANFPAKVVGLARSGFSCPRASNKFCEICGHKHLPTVGKKILIFCGKSPNIWQSCQLLEGSFSSLSKPILQAKIFCLAYPNSSPFDELLQVQQFHESC